MTTGRRPTIPPEDLADTIDEGDRAFGLTPVMADVLEEDDSLEPDRRQQPERRAHPRPRVDSDDFKAYEAAGWEWSRALTVKVEEHERMDAADHADHRREIAEVRVVATPGTTWLRRAVWVLGAMLGLAGGVFTYVIAFARDSGEATATAREREAQRKEDHQILLELRGIVSEIRGEMRARNPLGMVPLKGPPPDPAPQDAP